MSVPATGAGIGTPRRPSRSGVRADLEIAVKRHALMLKTSDSDEAPSGLLARTLGVLETLAANAPGMQLSELAESLHIPRSATHRVLTSLIEHGYVKQEREQGDYQLTAKIASLAFTFLAR